MEMWFTNRLIFQLVGEYMMTYTHYGEIGDVWKHLPLAEILSTESPVAYWESHAASGMYELTPTQKQEYGAIHYLAQASKSDVLKHSPYTAILDTYRDSEGCLRRYPGSPVIAMHILNQIQSPDSDEPPFVFCDIGADAINSLRKHVQELGIRNSEVTTVHDDGISTLASALSRTSPDKLAQTFVHLDPYWPGDTGQNGLSSWNLFRQLLEKGAQAMLWYGYQSEEEEVAKNHFFEEKIDSPEFDADGYNLWMGEIVVSAFRDCETPATDPGVFGCGIVCGNVRDRAIDRCREVGEALVSCYTNAELPDGTDGSLSFSESHY